MSRELFGINAFQSIQPSPVQNTRKQINSPPALASPLRNSATPPVTSNPIPSNEVATQKDRFLTSVLQNTPSPTYPSSSFLLPSQNSPPSPAFPLQTLATPPSPATLNPILSIEMATQKDEPLECVLKNPPSPPSPYISPPSQNSPPLPALPLQKPATSPSSNPISSNEAPTQRDKSLESFLRNTPSPPSPSIFLPPPPKNTPEMAHYQAATLSKKIISSSNDKM